MLASADLRAVYLFQRLHEFGEAWVGDPVEYPLPLFLVDQDTHHAHAGQVLREVGLRCARCSHEVGDTHGAVDQLAQDCQA